MRFARFAAPATLALVLLAVPLAVEAQQKTWDQHMSEASEAARDSRWIDAETSWNAAIQDAEAFGPSDRRLFTSLMTLGDYLFDHGRYTEAEALFRRALRIAEQGLGDDNVVVSLTYLGDILRVRGQYA